MINASDRQNELSEEDYLKNLHAKLNPSDGPKELTKEDILKDFQIIEENLKETFDELIGIGMTRAYVIEYVKEHFGIDLGMKVEEYDVGYDAGDEEYNEDEDEDFEPAHYEYIREWFESEGDPVARIGSTREAMDYADYIIRHTHLSMTEDSCGFISETSLLKCCLLMLLESSPHDVNTQNLVTLLDACNFIQVPADLYEQPGTEKSIFDMLLEDFMEKYRDVRVLHYYRMAVNLCDGCLSNVANHLSNRIDCIMRYYEKEDLYYSEKAEVGSDEDTISLADRIRDIKGMHETKESGGMKEAVESRKKCVIRKLKNDHMLFMPEE